MFVFFVVAPIVCALLAVWYFWENPRVSAARHSPLAILVATGLFLFGMSTAQVSTIFTDTGRLPQALAGLDMAQLTAISDLKFASWTLMLAWYAYIALVSLVVGSLLVGAAVRDEALAKWGRISWPARWARRGLGAMEKGSSYVLKRVSLTALLLVALYTLASGQVVSDALLARMHWDREGLTAFVMLIVFALVTTGVSDLVDRRSNRPPMARRLDRAWSLTSNALLVLVALNEAVWVEASSGGVISSRNHYVTVLLSVGFTAVAIAHLLDRTRRSDTPPSAIILVPTAFFIMITGQDNLMVMPGEATAVAASIRCDAKDEAQMRQAAATRWLQAIDDRLGKIPSDGPVFLVAASGGGTRAAIYAGLTLAWMRASGTDCGDATSERPVDFLNASGAGLDSHILLISSVSGGSLGSAYYWSHPGEFDLKDASCADSSVHHIAASWVVPTYQALQQDVERDAQRATDIRAAQDKVQADIRARLSETNEAFVEELVASEMKSLKSWKLIQAELEKLEDGRIHLGPEFLDTHPTHHVYGFPASSTDFVPIGPRAICSRFLDKVGQNFASPTVRGALLPFTSRGHEIEKSWLDRDLLLDIDDIQALDVADTRAAGTTAAEHPLLALNAIDVRTGGSVAIGMPALPPWLLHSVSDAHANGYALPPIAPLDVARGMDLSLSQAVRASAAVPALFDPVQVRSSCHDSSASLSMLDGGAYDNTGIDTLHAIMPILTDQARQSRFLLDVFTTDEDRDVASALMDKIRDGIASRGGLIIIEIDSSARPAPYVHEAEAELELTAAGTELGLGLDAWSRATFQHARASTLSMLAASRRAAPDESGGSRPVWPPVNEAPDGVVRLVYAPDRLPGPPHDVMSFWALGPTDIAYLLYLFDDTRLTAEPDLQREVQNTCASGAETRKRLADQARPPPTTVLIGTCSAADEARAATIQEQLQKESERLNINVFTSKLASEVVETLDARNEHFHLRSSFDEQELAGAISDALAENLPGTGKWPIALRAGVWGDVLTVVACGPPQG